MIDKELLRYIPADCSYDEWLKVGMALKHEGADWTVWMTGAGQVPSINEENVNENGIASVGPR